MTALPVDDLTVIEHVETKRGAVTLMRTPTSYLITGVKPGVNGGKRQNYSYEWVTEAHAQAEAHVRALFAKVLATYKTPPRIGPLVHLTSAAGQIKLLSKNEKAEYLSWLLRNDPDADHPWKAEQEARKAFIAQGNDLLRQANALGHLIKATQGNGRSKLKLTLRCYGCDHFGDGMPYGTENQRDKAGLAHAGAVIARGVHVSDEPS